MQAAEEREAVAATAYAEEGAGVAGVVWRCQPYDTEFAAVWFHITTLAPDLPQCASDVGARGFARPGDINHLGLGGNRPLWLRSASTGSSLRLLRTLPG